MGLLLKADLAFQTLGLYNFIRGFGWAYKRRGLYPGRGAYKRYKKIVSK